MPTSVFCTFLQHIKKGKSLARLGYLKKKKGTKKVMRVTHTDLDGNHNLLCRLLLCNEGNRALKQLKT